MPRSLWRVTLPTLTAGAVAAVTVAAIAVPAGATPSRSAFNPTTGFVVTGTAGGGPADFIFDSESGQITAWSPKADPANALVQFSSPTAVYKGLAMTTTDQGTFLYAANFNAGTVDVFNSTFQQVISSATSTIPSCLGATPHSGSRRSTGCST